MKKLLLGLGTLAAVVAPITTIVACGTTSDSGGKTEGPTTSNNGNQNPGIEGPTTSNNGNQNPVMEGSTKPDTENQNPVVEVPTKPDGGNKNPTIDETLVNYEQYRVNAFVSTGATQENEIVTTSSLFTAEIASKYGLSNNVLNLNTFTYNYTTTTTGITIVVSKTSDESKSTIVPIEILVPAKPSVSQDVLNSITQSQIASHINISPILELLPSDVIDLPTSVNVLPSGDSSDEIIVTLTWDKNDVEGTLSWSANIEGRTASSSDLVGVINGFNTTSNIELENIKAKQKEINALLSIGATATPENASHESKSSFDDVAIAKYGIKNIDGTPYIFDPQFTYEYVASDAWIKIYVSKDSKTPTIEPIEIPISRNSFEGEFPTLLQAKKFLAITTTVDDSYFNGAMLTSLSLPDATYIGGSSFSNSVLTSLSIPKAETIGLGAFTKAELTSLSLPEARTIEEWAFSNSVLTSLTIPKVTSIGDSAFFSSELNSSLSLPEATSIGESAFANSQLTSLDADKVVTIGYKAFFNSELTSLHLPEATAIEASSFEHSPLKSLYLPKIKSMGFHSFWSIVNSSSTSVTLLSDGSGGSYDRESIFNVYDQIKFVFI